MGMTTKSGKFFANPALGRAHERAEGGARGGEREERQRGDEREREPDAHAGGAHSVHIFKGEGGVHHVVAHHPDGPEFTEHDSLDDAMDHAKGALGDGVGDENEADGDGYGPSALETTL